MELKKKITEWRARYVTRFNRLCIQAFRRLLIQLANFYYACLLVNRHLFVELLYLTRIDFVCAVTLGSANNYTSRLFIYGVFKKNTTKFLQ